MAAAWLPGCMQHLMSGLRMHPLKTLELMAPTGTLTLLLGSAITELPDMLRNKAFGVGAPTQQTPMT